MNDRCRNGGRVWHGGRDGDGEETQPIPLPALRRLLTLLSASYGRRDLTLMLGLGAAVSLAEGAGLLLLVPVLDLVGVGGATSPSAGALLTGLGLYLLLVTAAAGLVAARSILSQDQRTRFVDRLRGTLHQALLRNWLRHRGGIDRLGVLGDLRSAGGLAAMAVLFARARRQGRVLHLWGHSWEPEERDLWQAFDDIMVMAADLVPVDCRMVNEGVAR
ncbi:hypothetical protein [Niveispirillum sp. KHB5.9]|uniref:hypothetical protein n=1 Tax=Niveispirillum sp. KHB5.9 TaxID=3400269 RepID=UPI003A890AAC